MKKILLLVVILILLGGIPLMVFYVGQRQELRKKAAPATTLSLAPASLTKKIDDTFSLEVTLDSGENQIIAAELHLTYDPTKLEVQSITNGPPFPNILASGTIENGAVSIAVGAADTKKPVTGTGTVAIIKMKALAITETPSSIKFSPNTFVGGLGEGANNVLIESNPATITIGGQQVQAPTTPTPTFTPTPTHSLTASPIPTQELTPTLTPTPTSTVSAQSPPPVSPAGSLTIVSPTNEGTATGDTPVIRGKASPGTTITLTIYSTPQTVTVTADDNGDWTYTPPTPLESGPHNIVASSTDQTGVTETATSAFVVASSTPIPVSGTVEITIVLLIIGSLFLGIGMIYPSFLSKP